jgi:hypothetical protein
MDVRERFLRPGNDAAPGWLQARLAQADRMIDVAWTVAALWAMVRLIAALWLSRFSDADEALWLLDPLLVLGLAYGLYRRSRVCAVLLLAYVVLELWVAYHTRPVGSGVGPAMLLGLAFAAGIRGTFLYHREVAGARAG